MRRREGGAPVVWYLLHLAGEFDGLLRWEPEASQSDARLGLLSIVNDDHPLVWTGCFPEDVDKI